MRIKSFPKFTKVLVVWEDTVSNSGWHEKQELEKAKPTPIQSMGFFLENRNRALKIAHNVTDDAESDYTIIPWGCVKKIRLLHFDNND